VPAAAPLLAHAWEREFPSFGRLQAFDGAVCASWPVSWRDADRYTGPWDRSAPTPALVIGNRWDPVTQFTFARRMADALDRAALVEVDSFGHTALGLNACASALTSAYLLAGALPEGDAACAADAPPF
jgi:hypothetical protein